MGVICQINAFVFFRVIFRAGVLLLHLWICTLWSAHTDRLDVVPVLMCCCILGDSEFSLLAGPKQLHFKETDMKPGTTQNKV